MNKSAKDEGVRLLAAATPGDWRVREMPGNADQFFVEADRIDPEDPYDIEVPACKLETRRQGESRSGVWKPFGRDQLISRAGAGAMHLRLGLGL